MASIQDHLIRLKCAKCGRVNYFTRKNRKKVERKIDLSKYCNHDRAHTQHKEAKKG
jgi:large subunit ribosomal protein L33